MIIEYEISSRQIWFFIIEQNYFYPLRNWQGKENSDENRNIIREEKIRIR